MNMKFKFLAAMTLAMGLFSCSNEEGFDNPNPNHTGMLGNAETYATIRIAMPGNEGAISKAQTDPENGDGLEVGTDNENKFHDIALYFFNGYDKTSTCLGVLTIAQDKFNNKVNEGQNVVYSTKEAVKVGIEGDNMKVYAVMNGSVIGANEGITLDKFLEKTVKTGDVFNGSLDKFLMTSRTPADLSLSANLNNTAEKAASLEVSVERTAAKISYMAKAIDNSYSVKDEQTQAEVATVTLNNYKLVNLRNDAYYFRKVASANGNWMEEANFGSGVQTAGNFVIDPFFTQKTATAAADPDFFTTWFGADKAYAENAQTYTALPSAAAHTTLGYCMENTTTQQAQMNGYSTGIIFKATYAPKKVWVLKEETLDGATRKYFEEVDYNAGDAFYRYADVLYQNIEDIKSFYSLTDEKLIETFEADAVNGGATCYYKYWIRHMDNHNPEQMGSMEFAIVRNNAYKLAVESVSGLGEPTDKIIPDTPDETSKMYLNVKVTIMPWVVRNNENIIL